MRSEMANYTRDRWVSVLALFCIIAAANARESSKFERKWCKDEIIEMQKIRTFTENTSEFFFRDPISGLLKNGPEDMTVTLTGCYAFCGSGTFYWDAVPRL